MIKQTVVALVASGLFAIGCSDGGEAPNRQGHSGSEKSTEKTSDPGSMASSLPGVSDDGVLKDEAQQRAWNPTFKDSGVAFNATEETTKAIGVERWEFETAGNIQGWVGLDAKGSVLGGLKFETKLDANQQPIAIETAFADASKKISIATVDLTTGTTKGELPALAQSWLAAAGKDSKAFQDTVQRPYGLVGCVAGVVGTGVFGIAMGVGNLLIGAACGVANANCTTATGKLYDMVGAVAGWSGSQCVGTLSLLNGLFFG